jgi:nitroimidazol reductase NimA-like FMN-containing flavoprotein (pyridoxamine 5'-phosphate oxidase superfamily)
VENLMRRQDLVLSREETLAIIDENQYAVLCLTDPDGRPYGLPMDYVRQDDVLYFHGSQEGRKIAAMKSNPRVCAVIVGETKIIPARFGREYKTAIVEGTVELINEQEMKRQVMTWVVERKSPDNLEKGKYVIEKMLDRVLVYKVNMEIVSGKHGL